MFAADMLTFLLTHVTFLEIHRWEKKVYQEMHPVAVEHKSIATTADKHNVS